MSARLIGDIEAEATKLLEQAAGFRIAGDLALSNTAYAAGRALQNAVQLLSRHHERLAEAQNLKE